MVKTSKKNLSYGFTLLELVITMAIFTMMLGIALSNYRSFSINALFSNDAESVALSLREAQIYGLGSKGLPSDCGFECAYGVHFENGANHYVLFVDKDKDDSFDEGESLEKVPFSQEVTITNLGCGGADCSSSLDVIFKRPNPDAIIKDSVSASHSQAEISVTRGVKTATTKVTRTGQISTHIHEEDL